MDEENYHDDDDDNENDGNHNDYNHDDSNQDEKINESGIVSGAVINDENEQLNLIISTKTLAANLRAAADEQKNLSKIKGNMELNEKLEEIFTEIEEQSKKIFATIKTSKTVQYNLRSLYASMLEVNDYFNELSKIKSIFFSKTKLKRKIQLLYQTLRVKCTQLMTSVSLELLTIKSTPESKSLHEFSEICFVGISFYFGINGRPKNYTLSFDKFLQSAELGDVDAMVMTARCYMNGHGVEYNQNEGLNWLEKAANSNICPHSKWEIAKLIISNMKAIDANCIKRTLQINSSESLINRSSNALDDISPETNYQDEGDMNDSNLPTSPSSQSAHQDLQYAIRLLLDASENGHVESKTCLGEIYEEIEDYEQAAKWYSLAATGGSSNASFKLGHLLLHTTGDIVSQRGKAFSLLQISALNGEEKAYNDIGLCYESGIGVDSNVPNALKYYRLGADAFDCQAMYNLGYLKVKNAIDLMEQLKLFQPQIRSLNRFNRNSNQNSDDPTKDPAIELKSKIDSLLKDGIRWLRAASEQHVSDASFQLGRLYEQAIGLPHDVQAALELYLYAADRNHFKAAHYAANILYSKCANKDWRSPLVLTELELAVRLYKKAAESGIPEAMNSYAILLEDGRGTIDKEPDEYGAAMWYYEASLLDYRPAFLNLALLLSTRKLYSFQSFNGEIVTADRARNYLEDHFSSEILNIHEPHSEELKKLLNSIPANSQVDASINAEVPEMDEQFDLLHVADKSQKSVNQRYRNASTSSSIQEVPTPLTSSISGQNRKNASFQKTILLDPASDDQRSRIDVNQIHSLRKKGVNSAENVVQYKPLYNSYDESSSPSTYFSKYNDDKSHSMTESPQQSIRNNHISNQVNTDNNHVSKLGKGTIYVTNGPIPPPNYVPKAVMTSIPSASDKPLPQKYKQHANSVTDNHPNIESKESELKQLGGKKSQSTRESRENSMNSKAASIDLNKSSESNIRTSVSKYKKSAIVHENENSPKIADLKTNSSNAIGKNITRSSTQNSEITRNQVPNSGRPPKDSNKSVSLALIKPESTSSESQKPSVSQSPALRLSKSPSTLTNSPISLNPSPIPERSFSPSPVIPKNEALSQKRKNISKEDSKPIDRDTSESLKVNKPEKGGSSFSRFFHYSSPSKQTNAKTDIKSSAEPNLRTSSPSFFSRNKKNSLTNEAPKIIDIQNSLSDQFEQSPKLTTSTSTNLSLEATGRESMGRIASIPNSRSQLMKGDSDYKRSSTTSFVDEAMTSESKRGGSFTHSFPDIRQSGDSKVRGGDEAIATESKTKGVTFPDTAAMKGSALTQPGSKFPTFPSRISAKEKGSDDDITNESSVPGRSLNIPTLQNEPKGSIPTVPLDRAISGLSTSSFETINDNNSTMNLPHELPQQPKSRNSSPFSAFKMPNLFSRSKSPDKSKLNQKLSASPDRMGVDEIIHNPTTTASMPSKMVSGSQPVSPDRKKWSFFSTSKPSTTKSKDEIIINRPDGIADIDDPEPDIEEDSN